MHYLSKVIITLILFYQSLLGETQLKNISIQLSWFNQFQFAGYYIAKEKGFYKNLGLNVEIKPFKFGLDISKDVSDNKIDFSIGRETLILEKLKHKNIVALYALFQASPLVFLSTKESEINSISDFEGKRIMTTIDDAGEASLKAMMTSSNIRFDDLEFLKHTHNINDLITKQTDIISAYVSKSPFELREKGIAYNIFEPKKYGFDMYSDFLYTSEALISKDVETVNAFKKASLRGWRYAYSHIEESVDLILRKYNTQNLSKEELIFEAEELKKLSYYNNKILGTLDKNKLQRINDLYNIMGVLATKIDIDKFIYSENKDSFFDKYVSTKYQKIFTDSIPLEIIVIFLIIIFLLFYKNILLKKNSHEKKIYLESLNEHILVLHTDINGIITNVSKALCKLTGYEKNELIGVYCGIFTHEDTDVSVYADVLNPLVLNNFWQGEVKSLKKDGTFYWADLKISALLDENGLVNGFSSIREDITDKKDKDATIFNQSKLISSSEIVTNIAHQWRQPLAEVNSVIMGIESDFNNNKMNKLSLENHLNKIETLTEYMSSTINDFHNFFKKDKIKTSFFISTNLNKALDLFEDSLKKSNIKINLHLIEDVMIETYEGEILQVLIVLLQNSKDAFLENNIQHPTINIELNKIDNNLVLSLQDNAGGIKSDVVEKIFVPYFSTKKEGQGIGLHLSKRIIEDSMHGTLKVQTNLETTLFTINIPL